MVTSLGCCWYSGCAPQSPDFWSSCSVWGKMDAMEMEDYRGIIIGDECEVVTRNLGEKPGLLLMMTGIMVGGDFLEHEGSISPASFHG